MAAAGSCTDEARAHHRAEAPQASNQGRDRKFEEVLRELISQNRLGDDDFERVSRICGQKVETIRKRVRLLQKEAG